MKGSKEQFEEMREKEIQEECNLGAEHAVFIEERIKPKTTIK